MFESLLANNFLIGKDDSLELTDAGRSFVSEFGIDIETPKKSRRPLCKPCLDWSARRSHLAGSLGTAFLEHFYQLRWAKRQEGTRIVEFTRAGEVQFLNQFPV